MLRETIKKLFLHLWKSLRESEEDQKIYEYKRFLSSIGGCLKFEVNDVLQQIIDEHWTKECEIEFKKYLSKYGFFADNAFRRRLIELQGIEKYGNFIDELQQHASEFQIKWCGFFWPAITPGHIPWNYMQSLKFKWGLKPEIVVKKCKYCEKKFIPVYDLRWLIYKIDKKYPRKRFCFLGRRRVNRSL